MISFSQYSFPEAGTRLTDMVAGQERLSAWLTAPSIVKRSVAMVVKIGLETLTFFFATGIIVLPLWIISLPAGSPVPIETTIAAWGAFIAMSFRNGYCFLTTGPGTDSSGQSRGSQQ